MKKHIHFFISSIVLLLLLLNCSNTSEQEINPEEPGPERFSIELEKDKPESNGYDQYMSNDINKPTHYVVPGGSGNMDGASWENAFADIQDAIDLAAEEAISDSCQHYILIQ